MATSGKMTNIGVCPPPFFRSSRDADALRRFYTKLNGFEPDASLAEIKQQLESEMAQAVQDRKSEYEQRVLKTFPNLVSFPTEKSIWEILPIIRRSSVFTGEVMRFSRLRKRLDEARQPVSKNLPPDEYRSKVIDAQERELFEAYRMHYRLDRLGYEETRQRMRMAVMTVQQSIDQLLYDYFPINHRKQLEYAANVRTARDIPRLIDFAARGRGRGVISKRIPFEARIIAVLAQLEFEHLISAHNPEHLDHVREELITVFENDVFDKEQSRRIVVIAELDPDHYYRVKRKNGNQFQVFWYDEADPMAKVQTTETRFVLHLDVRVIRSNGREVLVYFDTRRKERIFAKQLRKLYRKPEQITDVSGITFVLLSNDPADEELLANRLRATIVNCPGLVTSQASNAQRAGAIDPTNPHSSMDRRGEKYEFLWGVWHELQILQLPYFINSLVAHERDGHPFYKLVSYLDTLFPWIWPTHLYGLDWTDAEVRNMLWRHQCRLLQAA